MQKSLEAERQGGGQGRASACQTPPSTATNSSGHLPQRMSFRKPPVTSVVGEFRAPGIIASPGALIIRVAMRN